MPRLIDKRCLLVTNGFGTHDANHQPRPSNGSNPSPSTSLAQRCHLPLPNLAFARTWVADCIKKISDG
ncbi:hypothetical protein HYQ45_012009 [Verticillium longisporum]|uniref:Uncharacterized protein n=1 Tax=Verticillium longisporum TaxID=100787 RepID=A0A8I2ZDL4_VERLO|nr:hypothetical protein HYQ45_012009 [Verticillium longisporum]